MHDTFIAEAEARGWEVVYVDGNLDSLTQVNGSLDLLTQDIDALVMATWWIDAMPDVLDTAEKSGIPVFFMDQSAAMVPEGSTFASASGTDNYDAGYVGGVWMSERLKAEDKTSVNLVLVTMTSETAVKRCDGFVAGLSENGIEVTVLNEYLGDTRANGMRSMEDALVTYPEGEIDLVFGYSAQSSLGAYDAIVAANRAEIQVVGFDGEDDEIALIDAGTQYIGTVVQYPDQMAVLTAQLVEKVLNGETIEQSNPVAAGVYDGK
jgi:ribose transport system substrate-binding protein